MESVCYVARLRWNLMFSTIRSVTSVPASTAAESSRRSSVPTWPVCSITASRAGHEFTRRRAASSTSRWSRREPTGRVQCRSVGVKTTCSLCRLRRFGSAVVCLPSVACRAYKSNNVGFIIVVLLLCFCVLFSDSLWLRHIVVYNWQHLVLFHTLCRVWNKYSAFSSSYAKVWKLLFSVFVYIVIVARLVCVFSMFSIELV